MKNAIEGVNYLPSDLEGKDVVEYIKNLKEKLSELKKTDLETARKFLAEEKETEMYKKVKGQLMAFQDIMANEKAVYDDMEQGNF